MADALVSPAVGGTMWAASAIMISYCSKKAKLDLDEKKIPLMGVLGAFVFSAQMINFAIPGTGSSGHLGGALLLSILLGPHAAFLTMASILTVQALFFADGGLLSLGCNIFNIGFFPCFIAYPFIYKNITNNGLSHRRILTGAILAGVVGLQLGALGVILQTVSSNVSELPFRTFTLFMLPIHLAIGVVEGIVTVGVVSFVWKARPEILEKHSVPDGNLSMRNIFVSFLAAAIIVGGAVSWYASSNPDGLEWAISKTAGTDEIKGAESDIHKSMSTIQEKVSALPDYGFDSNVKENEVDESHLSLRAGTSISGIVGGGFTLVLSVIIGMALKRLKPTKG